MSAGAAQPDADLLGVKPHPYGADRAQWKVDDSGTNGASLCLADGMRIPWTASVSEPIGRCTTGTGIAATGVGWAIDLLTRPRKCMPRFHVRGWFPYANIV